MKRPCRNLSQTSMIKIRELHPIPLKTLNFNWMKYLAFFITFILFCVSTHAQTFINYAQGKPVTTTREEVYSAKKNLQLPPLQNGLPFPGKRAVVVPPEYEGSEVHHILYLPVDWDENWEEEGSSWPVIVEYTGNKYPTSGSTGKVEDAALGYGLSGGKFIWVVLPFVSTDLKHNEVTWWGDEKATVDYAKINVPRICANFGGDPDKVFICGFSRGAIAVNYIGLYNDDISRLWRGFITHDHYDGVREWNTYWGAPLETYRAKARERLGRMQGRPALVMQNNSTGAIQTYLGEMIRIGDFTFLDVMIEEIIPVIPHGDIISPHTDSWLLYDSKWTRFAQNWIKKVTEASE